MKEPFTRLSEKTAALGNYHRKYLHIISANIDKLTASLEQHGKRDRVHLWQHSLEIPGEMDTILEIADDSREKLDFLGCYFALQFLHMNLRLVDIVKLELATSFDRPQSGKKLMLESGRMFRHLTKCYMERLLDLFLEGQEKPEFVMLGVGTRADQDDIDLGIVHQNPADAVRLNKAIGLLAGEMFKKANRLHFHLSEHVGEDSFTATIEQYEEILSKGTYDFVIVTELLGAATILGNYQLFDQFRDRVTGRFYFDQKNKNNYFHEAYLRGILGEIHSLLTRLKTPETINPKDDALRPIKTLLSALKVVHGVDKVNAWNIIDDLKEKNPERISQYADLERTLSFFELFRHLYQIIVAQDEDIDLKEPGVEEMVAGIAEMIGFRKKGVVSAKDFMLVIYYEFQEKSIKAIQTLTDDLKKHLREISIFKPIFGGEIHKKPGFKGNLAVDFIRASSFVKGTAYWDDFQEELQNENNVFYNEFIDSFYQLPYRLMRKVAGGYVAGTELDPASVIKFLVILGEKAGEDKARNVFNLISRLFIEKLGNLTNMSAALVQMLHSTPESLNKFLALIEWELLAEFAKLARRKPAFPEFLPGYEQLYTLADVHYQSSHFFKQHFHKILNKYPVYIKNLHNNLKLKEITNGVYSDLTSLPSLNECMDQLGDYYDLEFVRVSLMAMAGADCELTDAEFIEFCDNYTLTLYELCQQDVHLSLGYSMLTHDLFALYATGGHAREQGFDDDYDMIVILDSTDHEKIDYCNKIVGKMNFHITKRGVLPHHRFADHFRSYVISINQLAEYIGRDDENVFIDQSQILCSRMLVGSSKIEQKLQKKIIEPHVFANKNRYIISLKREMESRHLINDDEHKSNIKECLGGCRDIEMLLLMYKVKYEVRDPLSKKLLISLVELERENAGKFGYLRDHMRFIKKMRDLYRLKVAASNIIEEEYLPPVAAAMGYGESRKAAENLYADFLERTALASKVIKKLVDGILTE